MANPYTNRPDSAFWKRAVAGVAAGQGVGADKTHLSDTEDRDAGDGFRFAAGLGHGWGGLRSSSGPPNPRQAVGVGPYDIRPSRPGGSCAAAGLFWISDPHPLAMT